MIGVKINYEGNRNDNRKNNGKRFGQVRIYHVPRKQIQL